MEITGRLLFGRTGRPVMFFDASEQALFVQDSFVEPRS